jgi:hypothetical protein
MLMEEFTGLETMDIFIVPMNLLPILISSEIILSTIGMIQRHI